MVYSIIFDFQKKSVVLHHNTHKSQASIHLEVLFPSSCQHLHSKCEWVMGDLIAFDGVRNNMTTPIHDIDPHQNSKKNNSAFEAREQPI